MIKFRGDDFLEFINKRAEQIDRKPAASPAGVCILPGQLLRRNLQDHLDRSGIPTATLSHFTTIEELAGDLLDTANEPSGMLSEGLRQQLIAAACHQFDPNPDIPDDVTIPEIEFTDDTLAPAQREALEAVAERIPYFEDDVQETILDELDDYYRCTDAGEEHDRFIDFVTGPNFEGEFEQSHSLRSIRAFRALTTLIKDKLAEINDQRHISRSHLVHEGRHVISDSWEELYDHVDWIAVAGISVFDNPTLRFLEVIGADTDRPDIHLFTEAGSFEYNHDRLSHLDNADPMMDEPAIDGFRNEGAHQLFAATQGQSSSVPDNVRLVEAATTRRLIEHIASDIRKRVQTGASPSDFLIIAPNAGNYQTLLRDAFETVNIPTHIETRRPAANIPAYRFLRDFVSLIEKAERDAAITYGELVDPLRLGYCNPSTQRSWPVEGRDFTTIEQRLHREQQQWHDGPDENPDQGIPLEGWEEIVADIPSWTSDWDAVETLLEDISDRLGNPPVSGDKLVKDFESYLGSYVWETFDHRRQLYRGPGIDNTRAAITETHVTSLAGIVRREFDAVGGLYNQALSVFDQDPSWGLVGAALSSGLGGHSYGDTHLDGNAVPVVDAGNAYFRTAEHVYVLGMNAGEFPSERETSPLLHENLRDRVAELASSGEAPYFHLDNERTAYGESADFYQASLAAASADADITLLHAYRDQRGNDVSWSSFVDLFDTDEEAIHTSVGEYLPQPRESSVWETTLETDSSPNNASAGGDASSAETWADLSARISPRERLRTVLYHANRPYPENPPSITDMDVGHLLADLDTDTLEILVQPRIERYHSPPTQVSIDPDEPAFADTDLETITGEPLHPHEVDLFSQCGLKYYYYQFLYNFEGQDPDRETIPYYSSTRPHHRLYELPKIIRSNYEDPRNVDRWQRIITDLLPDRQDPDSGLRQFESSNELREWFENQDINDFNQMLLDNLHRERELTFTEIGEDIDREWSWREQATITIEGTDLLVPPHRVDYLNAGSKTYAIPIFYGRFTNRARSALKACFEQSDPDDHLFEEESCDSICEWCADDDCQYDSKYVLDHRVLAGYVQEYEDNDTSVLGIGIQEAWADEPGSRHLIIKSNHRDKLPENSQFEYVTKRGYSNQWYNSKVPSWKADFQSHAEQLTDGGIQLEANQDLVDEECLRCVYKDLCFVPERSD